MIEVRQISYFNEDIQDMEGAYFHCWGGTSELVYGLVEKEDGTMVLMKYDEIVFANTPIEDLKYIYQIKNDSRKK